MNETESPLRIILSTFPSDEIAREVTHTLLEERLIACGNLIPGVTSIYRWQGAVETSAEVIVIFKTTAPVESVMARIKELHPYEVPEIVVLQVADVHPAYLAWARECIEG